jgi:hypothetical protein
VHVNLLFGPPRSPADDAPMMELFFSKHGTHIVCGGTTAKIAGRYLDRPVVPLPAKATRTSRPLPASPASIW